MYTASPVRHARAVRFVLGRGVLHTGLVVGVLVAQACGSRTWQGDDELRYRETRGQGCVDSQQPTTFGQSCTAADTCPEVRGGTGDQGSCLYCRRCQGITYDYFTGEVVAAGQCARCDP